MQHSTNQKQMQNSIKNQSNDTSPLDTIQIKKRRLRKLLSKARKGMGIVTYTELEELRSIQTIFLSTSNSIQSERQNEENNPKISAQIPIESESLLPYILLSSKHKKQQKKNNKRKTIENTCLSSPITSNTTARIDTLSRSHWQQCTGSDLRHILQRLLLFNNCSQSLPSWSMIQNPVACQNVAVIEFSSPSQINFSLSSMLSLIKSSQNNYTNPRCKKKTPTKKQVMDIDYEVENAHLSKQDSVLLQLLTSGLPYASSLSPPNEIKTNRIGLPLKTILFEGDSPKSLSDVLMYAPFKPLISNDKNTIKPPSKTESQTQTSLQERLLNLVLSNAEKSHNGYNFPINFDNCVDGDDEDGKGNHEELASMENMNETKRRKEAAKRKIIIELASKSHEKTFKIPPLEESCQIVKDLQVPTTKINQEKFDITLSKKQDFCSTSELKHLYVETFLPSPISCCSSSMSFPKTYGLDCEMVETSKGRELARITLVRAVPYHDSKRNEESFHFVTVFDELVKPYANVVDYLTQYSGITSKLLSPIQTRLEQIQVLLLSILKPTDILIGHSLENDLRVLKLCHRTVLDTAVLFSTHGKKHSLRHLVAVLLKKQIQQNASSQVAAGHCSEEDAVASMELAIQRAQEGDKFRLLHEDQKRRKSNIMHRMEQLSKRYQEHKNQTDAFHHQEDNNPKRKKQKTKFQNCPLYNHPGSFVYIGPSSWINTHLKSHLSSAHALACESIFESSWKAIPAFLGSKQRPASMLWAHLTIPNETKDNKSNSELKSSTIKRIEEIIQCTVSKIPPTCPILFLFQGGLDEANNLEQVRKNRSKPKATLPWTVKDEQLYKSKLDECRWIESIWVGTKHT